MKLIVVCSALMTSSGVFAQWGESGIPATREGTLCADNFENCTGPGECCGIATPPSDKTLGPEFNTDDKVKITVCGKYYAADGFVKYQDLFEKGNVAKKEWIYTGFYCLP